MNGEKFDPAHCPLCGQPNDCAMLDGKSTCWCFEEQISAEVLERVPLAAQGNACVCKRCGTSKTDPYERLRRAQELLKGR